MNATIKRCWSILLQIVPGASHSVLLFFSIALLTSSSLHAIIDSNNNGASDLWEKHYNDGNLYPTFDPNADPDGDGWTNLQEAVTGTDPADGNPPAGFLRPEIEQIPAVYLSPEEVGGLPTLQSPAATSIRWLTLPGKQYTLFSSADLSPGSWIPIDEPRIGSGSILGANIPLTQPDGSTPARLFWRVKIEDIDSDGDGLTDAEEAELGTDPENSDTDEDGLGDGPEVIGGTNPSNQDSDQDNIPDGLDVAPDDPLINWAKEDPFLFAQFPVSGQGGPIHVNDQGRVLFTESLWTNGSSQVLQASNGTELTNCRPRSISDNGFILGAGEIDLSGDDGKRLSYCLVTWPSPDGVPVPLRIRGEYVTPVFNPGFVVGLLGAPEIMFADLQVNGNGEFVAHYAAKTSSESGGKTYYNLTVDDDPQ